MSVPALAVLGPASAGAQTIFDGNPSNVTFVTNGANAGLGGGAVSTGSATDPLFFKAGGVNNSSGFSSTQNLQTLNGGTAIADTDTVLVTLEISLMEDNPDLPTIDGTDFSLLTLNTNGLEWGLATDTGVFRPTGSALALVDGRGSSDTRTNLGHSVGNIFGAPQAGPPGGTRESDGITEESLHDGFTIQMLGDATGFTTTVTDIVTTNGGETSYTYMTQELPGGTSFGDFVSDTYFYVTIQGAGTFNVAAATVELNPVLSLIGDYNGDGFVSQADLDLVLLNWGDAVAPAGFDEGNLDGGGPFDGLMSQNELDGVLLNWGNGTPPAVAVPEPASLAVLLAGGVMLARRRTQQQ